MSKLSMTEAVAVIPVSESTRRRDLKSGKVSFDTDAKARKQIDVSELTRVYGHLNATPTGEASAHVNNTHQNPSMNGTETPTFPFLTENDNAKVIALLEGQVQDLKAQLTEATTEKAELITLATNLQKQNEVLMLPPPKEKHGWVERLSSVFTRTGKATPDAK